MDISRTHMVELQQMEEKELNEKCETSHTESEV